MRAFQVLSVVALVASCASAGYIGLGHGYGAGLGYGAGHGHAPATSYAGLNQIALAAGHGYGAGHYGGGGYAGHDDHADYYAHPKYTYDYSVKDPHTGDHKNQWETRDGDVVKGSYSLAEADGTTRIVEYTSDKHNGFNAVVKRVGHAHHPQVYGHGHDYAYGGHY